MNITLGEFLRARRGDASPKLRAAIAKEIAEGNNSLIGWLRDVQAWAKGALPAGKEYKRETSSQWPDDVVPLLKERPIRRSRDDERFPDFFRSDKQAIEDFLQYRRGTASDEVLARVKKSFRETLRRILPKAFYCASPIKIQDLSGICDRVTGESDNQRLERFFPNLASLVAVDTPIEDIVEQLGLSRARIKDYISHTQGHPYSNGGFVSKPRFIRGDSVDGGEK